MQTNELEGTLPGKLLKLRYCYLFVVVDTAMVTSGFEGRELCVDRGGDVFSSVSKVVILSFCSAAPPAPRVAAAVASRPCCGCHAMDA